MIRAMLVIPLMAAALASSAPQIDFDYEGEVDVYTGAPATSGESEAVDNVSLADGGVYNRTSHMFRYSAQSSEYAVSSSVANGMVTTQTVSLIPDEGLDIVLYKDGAAAEAADISQITETGAYSVTSMGDSGEFQVLSFTIVAMKTGQLTNYHLPVGFSLLACTVDGEAQADRRTDTVEMTEEGTYQIDYQCNATGITYNLNVTVDHTPPQVTFEGLENGVAHGPVTMVGIAEEDRVTVIHDGNEMSFRFDDVLRDVGMYEVTVSDDAGNTISENFEIRMYMNHEGWGLTLLVLGTVIAVGTYMFLSRKRLRVR